MGSWLHCCVLALELGRASSGVRMPCYAPPCQTLNPIPSPGSPVQPSVRKALGVGDLEWEACNMGVHSDMMADVSCC